MIVVDDTHPIAVAAGVSGTITMTTSDTAASRLSNPGPAAQVIAETTKNRPSLFVFEQGTIAPARRAGMWPTWNTGTRSTATGFGLFDATVDWLLDTPAPNAPPTINGIADQTNDEGDAVSVTASATDPDPDTLTFSAVGLPDSVAINSATGEMSGVIDQDAASGSPYSVTVTVSDGRGGTDSTPFQWTVNPTADAPTVLVVGREPTVYSIDVPWVDRLVSRGFVVTYVDDDAFTAADLVGQDLVLVSTSVIESLSDEVAAVAAGANVPVGVWQAFAFEDFGFGTGEGRDSTGSALNIVDAAHPIAVAAGATGTFTVTTSSTAASRLTNPGVDAQVIAETNKNRASLFVFEAGTIAPARRRHVAHLEQRHARHTGRVRALRRHRRLVARRSRSAADRADDRFLQPGRTGDRNAGRGDALDHGVGV